jgi:hypothetical protein
VRREIALGLELSKKVIPVLFEVEDRNVPTVQTRPEAAEWSNMKQEAERWASESGARTSRSAEWPRKTKHNLPKEIAGLRADLARQLQIRGSSKELAGGVLGPRACSQELIATRRDSLSVLRTRRCRWNWHTRSEGSRVVKRTDGLQVPCLSPCCLGRRMDRPKGDGWKPSNAAFFSATAGRMQLSLLNGS